MRSTSDPIYSASTPPITLDIKMSEQLEADPDFEFFDSTALDAANSPSHFVDDLKSDNTSQYLTNLLCSKNQSLSEQAPSVETGYQTRPSTSLLDSPTGSYQDSISEPSDFPRKSSLESLISAQNKGGTITGDDTNLVGKWNNMLGEDDNTIICEHADGCIDPSTMSANFLNNEHSYDHSFNFGSSASSPSFKAGIINMESPELPMIKIATPVKHSCTKKANKFKVEAPNLRHTTTKSQPTTKSFNTVESREYSPNSAAPILSNRDTSNFFPSPSPGAESPGDIEYVSGALLSKNPSAPKWSIGPESYRNHGLPSPQASQNMDSRCIPSRISSATYPLQSILTIHPTPLKSRVETQIPIKMTLYPVPAGITKLHLPTHTISKPKLFAKPTPERSPDTLELYTSLVCTSAMLNPRFRKRAFERAASSARAPISPKEEQEGSGSDEDDENKPANGGEVKICGGCIIRERKRAARKKAKKVEEEDSWQQYETQRVIVFNTHEVKEWQIPSQYFQSETMGDHTEPYIPEDAMQVDAPMRIACYCRHQNEKSGFQVIFTLKDFQDKLVAQAITSSIMITDDHKTSTVPSVTPQLATSNDNLINTNQYGEAAYESSIITGNPTPFQMSHSGSDLQALQALTSNIEMQALSSHGNSPCFSHSPSTSMTPHLSRQASPTACHGPALKKRKPSGSNKLPSALVMTRFENGESHSIEAAASSIPSPFTPNFPNFSGTLDRSFHQAKSLQNLHTQFNGPPTPNSTDQTYSQVNRSQSMDNLMMQPMYGTPGSCAPSRVTSPNGVRDPYQRRQTHLAQAVTNGFYGIPISLNTHQPPTIHKMIPSEGPKAGGIEVTCLGIGFVQGLEIMFGDTKATTTTYWGETSLVCLLPPSSFAGNYPVTFKHQHQQQQMQPYSLSMPKQQAFFKYVDDDELQILRTALSVLGHKMTGRMEDVRELARRIVGDHNSDWGASARPNSDATQVHGGSDFNNTNLSKSLENILLKVLDISDSDDSLTTPCLNLRSASGQTMLDLDISLGLHQFVAALLARAAIPGAKDVCSNTPMNISAPQNNSHIVRKHVSSGADHSIQNIQGQITFGIAELIEPSQATEKITGCACKCSPSLQKGLMSSVTSTKSARDLECYLTRSNHYSKNNGSDPDSEHERSLDLTENDNSLKRQTICSPKYPKILDRDHEVDIKVSILNESKGSLDVTEKHQSSASIFALRNQVPSHIQQLQQILNLPRVPQISRCNSPSQIPSTLDNQTFLPNTNCMVHHITNLVQCSGQLKEQDSKLWDVFSSLSPAPPAYEDIFPEAKMESKISFETSLHDTSTEQDRYEIFSPKSTEIPRLDQHQGDSTISKTTHVESYKSFLEQEFGGELAITQVVKVRKLCRDLRLFLQWAPLLLLIIMIIFPNNSSTSWSSIKKLPSFYSQNYVEA